MSRHLNKPRFVKQFPRTRIIFRRGIWHVHVISHPIENPDEDNRVGFAARSQLAFAHHHAGQEAHHARARQEQP